MWHLLVILILEFAQPSHAAYRLYRLEVTYDVPGEKKPRVETVETNLDPYQWPDYHAEYLRARVRLLDTWYCPGDTSRHHLCPRPKVNDRTPASTYPSRNRLPYNLQPVIP
jgi:hypothetical protein